MGVYVEQELLTLPEHLSSPPVFSGVSCYSIVSFLCDVLDVCPFVLALSVLLRFTASGRFSDFS
jgi:hypothetical protein